jgi:cell wall-associated NlpC family hydrolase
MDRFRGPAVRVPALSLRVSDSMRVYHSVALIGVLVLGSCLGAGAQSRLEGQADSGQDVPEKQTLGQLGEITVSGAVIICPAADGSNRSVATERGTFVTVTGEREGLYAVLMTDGSTGWIGKDRVELKPYRVVAPAGPGSGSSDGARVVEVAMQYLGVSYKWGGNSVESGTDCSGFVKMVFSRFGVDLPRQSTTQSKAGQMVEWSDLRPGDRIYFATKGRAVNHCGIYIGGRYFIHASSRHNKVAVDDLSDPFYLNSLVVARR